MVGRETELKFLNQYYGREGCHILVVYGQRGVGKTTLLKTFTEGRKSHFYTARACSAREQLYQWGCELREQGMDVPLYPDYQELFDGIFAPGQSEKQILVVEEFHHIIKNDDLFLTELIRLLNSRNSLAGGKAMVILCTSASGWVENNMIGKIGNRAMALSGLLKVRELKPEEMRRIFPGFSSEDSSCIYDILGGVPGLWSVFDESCTAKENIIKYILGRESRLFDEITVSVSEELREPAVYYTILSAMARGCCKLNDIYKHTGFSRAKISVYLKNLMELEFVEKISSGTYQISNSYVKFYFRFLYPHLSMLHCMTSREYYERYMEAFIPYSKGGI